MEQVERSLEGLGLAQEVGADLEMVMASPFLAVQHVKSKG